MATGKKTFIFYSDWINMIREMPDADAGALLKHVLSYVNDENPETDNLLVKMAFGHMKPLLKDDLDKWDNIRKNRRIAGKKGGQAKAKQMLASAKQVEAVNDNVNVNVNDNVIVNDNILLKKETKKRFKPPSLLDVKNLINERNYKHVVADTFFNHYEANGWKVGKNKMKDWRSALAGWESRNKTKSNEQRTNNNDKPSLSQALKDY